MLVFWIDMTLFDLLLFLIFVLSSVLWLRSRRPSRYPPGPTPLPIIGNLHNVAKKDFMQAIRDLREKYGDIISLSLGAYWVVFVNGSENLREIFVKNANETSDRPPLFIFKLVKNKGVIASSGPNWKHQRTFALSKLRDFGFGKRSFESSILEEIENFLNLLESFKGKSFGLSGIIRTSLSNNVMSITVGRRFEYDDPKFRYFVNLLDEVNNTAALSGALNFIPILEKLPGDPFGAKRILEVANDFFDNFFGEELKEHRETLDENNIRDFIDAYLVQMKTVETSNEYYTDEQLLSVIADIFGAGTETSATTIEWAFVYLMNDMDVQNKMRQEIDDIVGHGRLPTMSDKHNLPYCEAVVIESLRLGNVVPFALPHNVSEDIHYKGYIIPKNAVIMPCLDSVAHDENLFSDSQSFKPDRFLDENGKICGQEKILSFSLGRRVCLGESLARMEVFLYLTALVQRFDILPADGESPPPIKGQLGVTYSPGSFKLRAISRN